MGRSSALALKGEHPEQWDYPRMGFAQVLSISLSNGVKLRDLLCWSYSLVFSLFLSGVLHSQGQQGLIEH